MTTDLLSGPLAQALGLTLLHTLWQGAIVACIVAALLALMRNRSASMRYAVACGALAIVVLLAIGTAWQTYTPQHVAPLAMQPVSSAIPDDAVVITGPSASPTWNDRVLVLLAATRAHIPQIVILWLAGVLILSIRLGVSWWRVQALARRDATEADEVWQRAATRLAAALGLERPIRIVISSSVDVPSVVGWLKPVVLLAVSSVSGLTTEQLEMVLAHELAHIRRHDFLVNAIQSVVETLLFYNPAVWWMSRQIRIERENCCDDLAVSVCGDAVAYARALAQLESMRGVPAAAAAANGGSLVDRVRRLVGSHSERTLFPSGWTAAAAITSFVLLLGLATAPLFAEHKSEPAPQAAGTKIEVSARQAAAPVPKIATSEDPDEDMEPADPPEPPARPARPARVHRIVVPRITDEVRASLEAAMAGLDLEHMSLDEDEQPSTTPPGKLSVNDLIALKIQGVTPEYIEKMRAAGLGDVPIRDIISMRVQRVTPEYVASMRSAGAPIKTARDVIGLKVQNVTPEFVRSLVAAGYDHLSVHDIVRLATFGVNGDFIREMSKYKNK